MSEIGRIDHDAERRLLLVELREDEDEDEDAASRAAVDLPVPASFAAVEPGEERALTNRLSSPITRIEEAPDGSLRAVHIRLGEYVDAVQCAVAYSETEPPESIDLAATDTPGPTDGWEIATATTTLV